MKKKPLSEECDEELMEQYRLACSAAFDELYLRHSARVYGYLEKKLGASDAPDVFQSVFMKLHRSRLRYNRAYQFLPWLFTIARHCCIDHQRQVQRRKEEPYQEECAAQTVAPNSLVKEVLESQGVLSERERQIVALRFVDDRAFEEIAERLQLQPSNIRKISSRAIQKLRRVLGSDL